MKTTIIALVLGLTAIIKFLKKQKSKDQMESFFQSFLPAMQERKTIEALRNIEGFVVQITELSLQGKAIRKKELEEFYVQRLISISGMLYPEWCGEKGIDLLWENYYYEDHDS